MSGSVSDPIPYFFLFLLSLFSTLAILIIEEENALHPHVGYILWLRDIRPLSMTDDNYSCLIDETGRECSIVFLFVDDS